MGTIFTDPSYTHKITIKKTKILTCLTNVDKLFFSTVLNKNDTGTAKMVQEVKALTKQVWRPEFSSWDPEIRWHYRTEDTKLSSELHTQALAHT